MDARKFKALVVEHWVPVLITGLVGLVAALSLALLQAKVSDNRFFLERQALTADRVALEMSRYIENWRRIMQLKKYVAEANRSPSPEDMERLKAYVAERDSARDRLFSSLDAVHLYFGEQTAAAAVQFRVWDEEQAIKTAIELPVIDEWRKRGHSILSSMREELRK